MTREDIENFEAGPELDALVAEKVLGWTWVQPPKFDVDGPLPKQGEVLVPPELIRYIERRMYEWIPRGIVTPRYFVTPRRFSIEIERAWEIVEEMHRRGNGVMLKKYRQDESLFSEDDQHPHRCSIYNPQDTFDGYGPTMPLAICRASLLAVLEDED